VPSEVFQKKHFVKYFWPEHCGLAPFCGTRRLVSILDTSDVLLAPKKPTSCVTAGRLRSSVMFGYDSASTIQVGQTIATSTVDHLATKAMRSPRRRNSG
jgi:hypothetical protein